MAVQPHNKTGKKYSTCEKVFTAPSMVLTITRKSQASGFIESRLVCPECHHDFYSQGE